MKQTKNNNLISIKSIELVEKSFKIFYEWLENPATYIIKWDFETVKNLFQKMLDYWYKFWEIKKWLTETWLIEKKISAVDFINEELKA